MTDVLLTHSYHLANDAKQLRKMQPYAPLGTLYAAAALRDAGFSVTVFDTTLRDPRQQLEPILLRNVPKLVVLYEDDFNFISKMCLLSMRETARFIATLARSVEATVIAHGSDETDFASEYLDAGIDFILTGEAEETLLELCRRLLADEDPYTVPGLVWRDDSGTLRRSTNVPTRNAAWASVPAPARELIDMEPYRRAWTETHGRFSANVVASRGCPYSCNWCAKPISGNRFQLRPADAVAREIRELKELYGAQHLWFSDDIFGLNRHWLRDFAAAVSVHRARLPYKIQSRADLLTDEIAALLAASGCTEVWMGVESGSQKVLDAMDKNLRLEDVYAAVDRLRRHGIEACFFLQLGYPGEGWDEIQETLHLVRAARPDDIGVSISYPLPGTVFYQRVQAELAAKRNWQDSDDLCVTFSGAYSGDFYRTVRDALHAEVTGWRTDPLTTCPEALNLWRQLEAREPHSRQFASKLRPAPVAENSFFPLSHLASAGGFA